MFNFKVIFPPMNTLREEHFIPSLLLKQLCDGNPRLMKTKAEPHVRDTVIRALREWVQEQVEAGTVPTGWEVATLDRSPFNPGWKNKWQAVTGL